MPKLLNNRVRGVVTAGLGALLSACTDIALQAVNVPSYVSGNTQSERGLVYGEGGRVVLASRFRRPATPAFVIAVDEFAGVGVFPNDVAGCRV